MTPSSLLLDLSLLSPCLTAGTGCVLPAGRAEPGPVSAGCIDMLSIEGQFTFTADQPQLHCATFFIGEPEELLTIEYDFVNIDCQGGDFLKVGSCCLSPSLLWILGAGCVW